MRSRRKDFKKYLEAFRLAAQANVRFPAETWVTPLSALAGGGWR